MNDIEKDLLAQVSDLHSIPTGAFNIRENGVAIDKRSTENIQIVAKPEGKGIDIYVKDNTQNESLHIPVIITKAGIKELVYNDFHIGRNCDILIVAGCGIHNTGATESEHNGIHTFYVGKNSKVRYVEKHLGVGTNGGKILNPVTNVNLEEGSELVMETTQLGGVTSSIRETNAKVGDNAKLLIKEKILTDENQIAETNFNVELIGKDSSVDVISRSVAKSESKQKFYSKVVGKSKCFGHVECDAILMDKSSVQSTPEILAENTEATLVHEAAIGKIAGEQLIKLMTMGLTEKEAEDMIIKGFLG